MQAQTTAPQYPEHDKLRAVAEESQAIGEFLDMGGYTLCKHVEAGNNGKPQYVWTDEYREACRKRGVDLPERPRARDYFRNTAEINPEYDSWGDHLAPVSQSIEAILAEWFGIDRDALEREKRAMLEALRA